MVVQYNRGRTKEHETVHALKNMGYIVTRSAGSKGIFDIIAVNEEHVRLIQVKLFTGKNLSLATYRDDLNAIYGVKVPPICTKELWIYQTGKGLVRIIHTGVMIHEWLFPKDVNVDMRFEWTPNLP